MTLQARTHVRSLPRDPFSPCLSGHGFRWS